MKIRPLVIGLTLAAPLFAQANYSINNSAFSCSAALSFANSTGLDAHCTGNFSVTGGTWTSDTKIALTADGNLTLDGVAMTAPVIELSSLTKVALLGDTLIRATGSKPRSGTIDDGFGQVPGRVDVQPGADVSLGGGLVRTETGFSGNINSGAISGGTLTLSAGGTFDNPRAGSGSIVTGSFFGGGNILTGGAETHLIFPVFLERPVMYLPTIQLTGVNEPARSQTLIVADAAPIPEPETHTLALAALATGAALARRRKA